MSCHMSLFIDHHIYIYMYVLSYFVFNNFTSLSYVFMNMGSYQLYVCSQCTMWYAGTSHLFLPIHEYGMVLIVCLLPPQTHAMYNVVSRYSFMYMRRYQFYVCYNHKHTYVHVYVPYMSHILLVILMYLFLIYPLDEK